jgi:DNA-binding GntR family transcriptional regulator
MALQLVRLESTPDLVDRVYRALVDAISDGSLAPGARLTQEVLAERLAVSRQPVLQAMRMLRQDGLVVDAPGRGVQVIPLDAASIARVYQVRGALDALAASLAAQQGRSIAPELLARGRASTRGGDVQAMIEADMAFHRAVYAASGNPMIEQSARLHWCHIRRAMGAVMQSSSLRTAVWDEHEGIAHAIAIGDAVLAERLSREHCENASNTMSRRLAAVLDHPKAQGDTP